MGDDRSPQRLALRRHQHERDPAEECVHDSGGLDVGRGEQRRGRLSSPAARGDTEKLGGAPLDGRKSRHHSERDGEIDEPELLLQLKQRANDSRAGQQIIHHVHNETGRDVAVEARHKRQANAGEEGEHDRWWRNMGRPENR